MSKPEILPCKPDEWKPICEGLEAFNRAQLADLQPVPVRFPQFKLVVDGILRGGILGRTEPYGALYIEVLHVDEALRGRGLGTRLIERMHQYVDEHQLSPVYLTTHDFQALGFYEKNGYVVFGQLDECPPTHTKYFMRRVREPGRARSMASVV